MNLRRTDTDCGPQGDGQARSVAAEGDRGTVESRTPSHVVGIGASAGGLEALETLFDNMPSDTGMAFVVVQHLSPDFKSMMDELLARHTRMPVHSVADGVEVEPNAIYLIPPRKEMIISGGRLLLTDKDPSHGLTLPIDIFFRSLAQDYGDCSVGVILSGTGSDGSRGIRAIHDAGGLVIVQDGETARFDGMPRSALDTGAADIVLPPDRMPGALLRHLSHDTCETRPDGEVVEAATSELETVFRILHERYGINFSHYKPATVGRRLERRLSLSHVPTLREYLTRLENDPAELNALYHDLLIGVTQFFRDEEAFELLENDVLPALLERVHPEDDLRIWVAGCATGEEVYSLAILVHELLTKRNRPINAKIFATDVHADSLAAASAGAYRPESLEDMDPRRRERYFKREGDSFVVAQELRQLVVFAPHNVIKDAPFTRLDLITCRNLLIYLQAAAQKKALSLFHFALKTGGVLFLGPSETPGEISDEFEPIDRQWKMYRKRRDARLPADMRLPLSAGYTRTPAPDPARISGAGALADKPLLRAYDTLLNRFVPSSFLVDGRQQVVHTFAGAGRWLRPRDGRVSTNALELVPPDLKLPLSTALQRAAREDKPIVYTGVEVSESEGSPPTPLRVIVEPIRAGLGDVPYALVILEASERRPPSIGDGQAIDMGQVSREQIVSLEEELRYTKENLQATIEELETSNEELQASNEELVASNEELQSTNEELHSVNEELYTVNAEYQKKIVELTELTDDMENLLTSTEIGTLFLDRGLRIRKFTARIAESFNLLPQDLGRRFDSFTHNIDDDGLLADLERVLVEQIPVEREVRDRHGRWMFLRVLPYRSRGRTDGVVLTLVDISTLKRAQSRVNTLSAIVESSGDAIIATDLDDGTIESWNRGAERMLGYSAEEAIGRNFSSLMGEDALHVFPGSLAQLRRGESTDVVEAVMRRRGGGSIQVALRLSPIYNQEGELAGASVIARDITEQKRSERAVREAVERRDQFLAMLSHELRNPLGAVLNAAHVMDRDPEHRDVFAMPRQVIQRQAAQMARLLDDLLDVSRVTRGKIELRPETLDLRSVVSDALEVVRPLIDSRELQTAVELPDEPVCVEGDGTRLQQVYVNLLNNAAKYSSQGGHVWVTVAVEGSDGVVSVRDDGMGIAPELREKIFELFVQSDETLDRSEGGMGVGLTLARGLVELHGGRIEAASDGPGHGSEFTVRLPLSSRPLPECRDGAPPIAQRPSRTVRVVVVEDNSDSREMLSTMLDLDGYTVRTAADGQAGLDLIAEEAPDVALVDIGLPGLDGYEVARRIRSQVGRDTVRLVALTGYGRETDRQAVRAAGFDAHLVKPVNLEELYRVLNPPSEE